MRLAFIAVISLFLASCHHPDSVFSKDGQLDLDRYQKVHSVTWLHYNIWSNDDPEKAVYVMDGLIVGPGRQGYDLLIKKINALPEWELVIVYYLNDKYPHTNGGGTLPDFPFDKYPIRINMIDHKAITMNQITAVSRPEGLILKGYKQP